MLIKENQDIYFSNESITLLDVIPVGNYALSKNERGFYLTCIKEFTFQNKLFGNPEHLAERYLKTFDITGRSMGVLLSGTKGSGKTLTAKLICQRANLPVIVVSQYYEGTEFHKFLQNINQQVIIFVDEFEKSYNKEQQEEWLPILDGAFTGNKLFIFTSNTADINEFLLNRPSRIRYHEVFEGLQDHVVQQVVQDMLENKEHAAALIEASKRLGQMSFDSLITVIEEMNIHKAQVSEVLRYLNLKMEDAQYKGVLITEGKRHDFLFTGHPLANAEYLVEYRTSEWWRQSYTIKLRDFSLDFEEGGRITLENDTTTIKFERITPYKIEL